MWYLNLLFSTVDNGLKFIMMTIASLKSNSNPLNLNSVISFILFCINKLNDLLLNL